MTSDEWLALAERCEKATGADREIDALIHMAIEKNPPPDWIITKDGAVWCWRAKSRHPAGTGNLWAIAKRYTRSMDEITAATKTEFPTAYWSSEQYAGGTANADLALDNSENLYQGTAVTEALARCAAFCRAMSEKVKNND